MIVIISGSRRWTDLPLIARALRGIRAADPFETFTLIHGACRGADLLASDVAKSMGWRVIPFPADWEHCGPTCKPAHRRKRFDLTTYCPTAGLRRNQSMIDYALDHLPAILAAFPLRDSRGTWDAVNRAESASIPITIIDPPSAQRLRTSHRRHNPLPPHRPTR